ncbi:Vesicle-associated protein 2-1 [Datura stramonium]|uniref:Vesicle-associated protein 2-1 n=1 Tax=Datura stramonium TaxID=4076 RepID=A0ABS8T6A3_DATST|nr:Vesicle-associated protein 2-1 [Datura stramonium]
MSFEVSVFTMSAGATNQLISVSPPELKFQFELDKQSYCDLKVTNSTDQCVAFKVKTTSPKKYFVRPNTGIIQPWDSSFIRVTLQAQKEYPPDMQCKDKFLLQSTILNNDIDELPPDTFTKEGGRTVEECKLRVVYVSSNSSPGHSEDVFNQSSDFTSNQALQRIKEERDAAVRQTQQLLQELEIMKRRRNRNDPGFSLRFAIVVGVIGLMVGFLLKLLSSPSVE